MSANLPPDDVPRVVKPRRRKYTHRPIIALTDSQMMLESGQILPADQLPLVLLTEPSSILVAQGFGIHLERLRASYKDMDRFQYRVTPRLTPSRNTDDETDKPKVTQIRDAIVNFVGFQGIERGEHRGGKDGGSGRKWTRYHYPIDPVHFVRSSIDEVYPDPRTTRLNKLFQFGKEVREFCQSQLLEVKPTAGGLAAQLLRDPRFYPEPRRKVPGLVNDYARPRLPGNYYRLHADQSPREYDAAYVDMSNAHHAMARALHFPNSNDLHAYGRWAESDPSRPYVDLEGKRTHLLLTLPGLFHLRIRVPHIPMRRFPPPFMQASGERNVWVFSNELELIEELGGEILAIHAAFVSHERDTGLNRYAEWAMSEITSRPGSKGWLKPTLHAAYGILAARAVPFETGYLRASGDLERKDYPLGRYSAPVLARTTGKAIESGIVNVIQRGMIEAEVRRQSLQLARELTEGGYNVLSVYADSLFIEGNAMPFLPPPWRLSEYCSGLRFLTATHFVSDQVSRLPGIPKAMRGAREPSSEARSSREGIPGDGFAPGWRHNPAGRFQVTTGSDKIGS